MEMWKDIPGYESLYQASNTGKIRSSEGKVTSNALCARRVWKSREIKQKLQERSRGHGKDARVELWKNGKHKTCLVSRLIAQTWCDGYAEDLTVNHIDGNPMNNNADNLEWVTRADNIRKGFEDGLFSTQKPVSLKDKYGKVFLFRSMSEASRFLCCNHGYISNLKAKKIVFVKGYEILF